jgi:hypothetical protein
MVDATRIIVENVPQGLLITFVISLTLQINSKKRSKFPLKNLNSGSQNLRVK